MYKQRLLLSNSKMKRKKQRKKGINRELNGRGRKPEGGQAETDAIGVASCLSEVT